MKNAFYFMLKALKAELFEGSFYIGGQFDKELIQYSYSLRQFLNNLYRVS